MPARRAWRTSWTRGCCWSPAGKGQGCGPAGRKQGRGQRHSSESELSGRRAPPAPQPPRVPPAPQPHQAAWRQIPVHGLDPRVEGLPHNDSHVGDSRAPCASLILESPTLRCPKCSCQPNTSPPECLLQSRQPESAGARGRSLPHPVGASTASPGPQTRWKAKMKNPQTRVPQEGPGGGAAGSQAVVKQ